MVERDGAERKRCSRNIGFERDQDGTDSVYETSAYVPGAPGVQPLAGVRAGAGHRPGSAADPVPKPAAVSGAAAAGPLSFYRGRPGLSGGPFFRHGHDQRADPAGASPGSTAGRSAGGVGLPPHQRPGFASFEGDAEGTGLQRTHGHRHVGQSSLSSSGNL